MLLYKILSFLCWQLIWQDLGALLETAFPAVPLIHNNSQHELFTFKLIVFSLTTYSSRKQRLFWLRNSDVGHHSLPGVSCKISEQTVGPAVSYCSLTICIFVGTRLLSVWIVFILSVASDLGHHRVFWRKPRTPSLPVWSHLITN